MSIIAAFAVPHPPLIIPAVGKGEEKDIQATVDAYDEVAQQIARIQPETVIVTSPHTTAYTDYFHISPGQSTTGDMSQFRVKGGKISVRYDTGLVANICIEADKEGLPAGTEVPAIFRRGVADNEAEVRRRVNEILDAGADFIKVIATGAVLADGTEPGQSEYTEAEIRAAVEEAGRRGRFVAAHAHGAEGIKRAVRAGARSIEHGSLMDDEAIALMKLHGTFLVADIYNGDYIDSVGRRDGWSAEILRKNLDTTEAQREGFRKAVAAGVNIAYGTDSGVYPHGDNARQFAYMVRYGMTPLQAIRAATLESARLLGRRRNWAPSRPASSPTLSPWPAIRWPTSPACSRCAVW